MYSILFSVLCVSFLCQQANAEVARVTIKSCSGWQLNRYPSLKQVLHEIGKGTYQNINVEYVGGLAPVAVLYSADGNELEQVPLSDLRFDQLKGLLKEHNFVLQKKESPPPKLKLETTLGGVRYEFFEGTLPYQEAEAFAAARQHEGHTGRLLTLRCKNLEDQLGKWLLHQHGTAYVWLGLTDTDAESTFTWSMERDLVTYTNWIQGEPNNANDEDCVMWHTQVGWNDSPCTDEAQIVVEYGPAHSLECDSTLSDVSQHHVPDPVDL